MHWRKLCIFKIHLLHKINAKLSECSWKVWDQEMFSIVIYGWRGLFSKRMAWSRRLRPSQDDALVVWTLSESVFAADDRVPGTGSCSNYELCCAARGPVIQCVPYRLAERFFLRLDRVVWAEPPPAVSVLLLTLVFVLDILGESGLSTSRHQTVLCSRWCDDGWVRAWYKSHATLAWEGRKV